MTYKCIVFICLVITTTECELLGENVCKEERRIKFNVTEYFVQNITVRDYKWCVNVPPRCSYYTVRPVIIPRTVEKERFDVIETCCPGFVSKEQQCIPSDCASKCLEGKCDVNEENCVTDYISQCEQGVYDKIKKSCICNPGWKGNRCESLCDEGYFGEGCLQKCKCTFCDSVNGECGNNDKRANADVIETGKGEHKLGPPRLQKYYTFDVTTNTPHTLATTTEIKDSEQLYFLEKETPHLLETTTEIKGTSHFYFENKMPHLSEITTEINNDNREKTPHFIQITTAETQPFTKRIEIDEVSPETLDVIPIVADGHVVFGIASAVSGGLIVVVLVATLAILRHLKKIRSAKRSNENGVKYGSERAATNGLDDVHFRNSLTCNIPISNISIQESMTEMENRSECDMKGNYCFYDYPPSTGSYRAASLPEPSEIELNSLRLGSQLTVEHVYDEIPAHRLHKCTDIISHQANFSVYFSKSPNALYSNEGTDNCKHCIV